MKNKLILLFVLLFGTGVQLSAQVVQDTTIVEEKISIITYDSLKVQLGVRGDSLGRVEIFESNLLNGIFNREVVRDGSQLITISRISIFLDNSQNARADAIETMTKFEELFPDIPAALIHENPYFKVTVGVCISNEEALILLNKLRGEFPKAFVVRERVSVERLRELVEPARKESEEEENEEIK